MKLIYSLLLVSCFSSVSFGQVSKSENNEVKGSPTEFGEISRSRSPLTEDQKKDIDQKIAAINSHLSAIEKKREYILNDPEMKATAEAEGWFKDMEETESRLNEKKKGLLETLENDRKLREGDSN
ncbi:MAG: hypothetical protein EP305_08900 [Bacteroidetes bacterium]|nr:MAG: hypothetical protein EP305_08900 [Bacteroidota bacterium]